MKAEHDVMVTCDGCGDTGLAGTAHYCPGGIGARIIALEALVALLWACHEFRQSAVRATIAANRERHRADALDRRAQAAHEAMTDAFDHADEAQRLLDEVALQAARDRHPAKGRHLAVVVPGVGR